MPKTKQAAKQKACLICIDGWGISPDEDKSGDAIFNGETPVMDKLEKEDPFVAIAAHGLSVGLPDGLMGNSEVGHLNIGAGRVVYQVSVVKKKYKCNTRFNLIIFVGYCPHRSRCEEQGIG